MKYIRLIDQTNHIYPYDIKNLKIDFPNVSFSPNSDLSDWGIFIVNYTPQPSDITKNYTEEVHYDNVNEIWYNSWIGVDKTPEEINELKKVKWGEIRSLRNSLLSDCDWTQLSDSPLTPEKKQEWISYRQLLRDVTLQPDPFNITWPVIPD